MSSKLIATFACGILVVLTWLAIAIYPVLRPPDHFGIGLLLGSFYGHCILASAWAVLGPGDWRRWPLAIIWCFTVPIALYVHVAIYSYSEDFGIVWASGLALVFLVLIAIAPLRFLLGIRIENAQLQDASGGGMPIATQFGIQHLMIITTGVAVIVGGGRMLTPYLQNLLAGPQEAAVFGFLIVVASVLWAPLVFSVLGMQRAFWPTLFSITLVVLATYLELPLLLKLGLGGGAPDWLHLTLINFFTILPILFAAIALRVHGYRVQRSG